MPWSPNKGSFCWAHSVESIARRLGNGVRVRFQHSEAPQNAPKTPKNPKTGFLSSCKYAAFAQGMGLCQCSSL